MNEYSFRVTHILDSWKENYRKEVPNELYRFVDSLYCDSGLMLEKWVIIRKTPSGYWIADSVHHNQKWTSGSKINLFAEKTIERALISYITRKNRHKGFLGAKMTKLDSIIKIIAEFREEMADG